MAKINSVVVHVISLLRHTRPQRSLTAAQAAAVIPMFIPHVFSRRGTESFERLERYIGNRLEELADLGMVSGDPDAGYQLRWGPGQADEPITLEEGGTRPPEPPDITTFDDGPQDGPGIGVREVLSHPTLFALSDEDFDDLLVGMLGDGHGS